MTQRYQKGSMISVTFTLKLGQCVHARVVVYMYLNFVMTGQNISNDGDKCVLICISPTFIEPSVYQGIKVWHASGCSLATLTIALTLAKCGVLDRRKTKVS